MPIYTMPEIKKELKSYSVDRITTHIEEFGEGFDSYITVYYSDKFLNQDLESWQVGEEESLAKAIARGKRSTTSLEKLGYKIENEGLAC